MNSYERDLQEAIRRSEQTFNDDEVLRSMNALSLKDSRPKEDTSNDEELARLLQSDFDLLQLEENVKTQAVMDVPRTPPRSRRYEAPSNMSPSRLLLADAAERRILASGPTKDLRRNKEIADRSERNRLVGILEEKYAKRNLPRPIGLAAYSLKILQKLNREFK